MNFATMTAELQARGFFTTDATRAGLYINQGRAELDAMFLWPYREAAATGTAPLTVADLGVIEAVTNETYDYALMPGDYRSLTEEYGDLSLTGLPKFFYVGSGTTVATYPTNTDTIGVQYWKVTADLTGVQTPLAPARFHSLIIDLAQRDAYGDRDNDGNAGAIQGRIDRKLAMMVDQLLGGQQVVGAQERQMLTYDACDW